MTTPGPTSRIPALLTIVAGSLLLVVLLAFGARWRMERRAHEAADSVVAEARERAAALEHVVRPSHVDPPVPGTLAQALGPLMPELIALQQAERTPSKKVHAACTDVRNGVRPVSELPRACREALERGRPLMQRALKASRAEEGTLPEGLRIFDDPQHPYQREGSLPLQHILELAALEIRLQTQQGQADAALETCLDGLALARDLAYGGGFLGEMVSASGHGNLFSPCAEALDRASPSSQQQARVALRRIRAGLVPLSSAVRDERAFMPLYLDGGRLDRDQLDALPAGARALATQMPGQNMIAFMSVPPVLAPTLMLQMWPQLLECVGRAIPVMDLPPDQRTPRLAAQARAVSSSWNPLVRECLENYEQYATRVDKQRAELDLLLALTLVKQQRAESGTWPSEPPTLYPGQQVLLPTALKLQRGEGGELLLFPAALKPEELSVTATP